MATVWKKSLKSNMGVAGCVLVRSLIYNNIANARCCIEVRRYLDAAQTLGVFSLEGFFRFAKVSHEFDIGIRIPVRVVDLIWLHYTQQYDKRPLHLILIDLLLRICALYKWAAMINTGDDWTVYRVECFEVNIEKYRFVTDGNSEGTFKN